MHKGRLTHSPRLRRVLRALQRAEGEISSMDLVKTADVVAPGTAVSELRANGAEITCRQVVEDGQRRFLYTLVKSPEGY